jgi:hypothetical protein
MVHFYQSYRAAETSGLACVYSEVTFRWRVQGQTVIAKPEQRVKASKKRKAFLPIMWPTDQENQKIFSSQRDGTRKSAYAHPGQRRCD